MFKSCAIILLLITNVRNEKFEWVQQLTNHIENEAKLVNQIIILQVANNKLNEKCKIEDLLFTILAKFPNRVIDFRSENVQDQLSKLSTITDPQTVLFVLLHYRNGDKNFSQLSKPINFVSNISNSRSRPKCLIICLQSSNSVKYAEKLLRRMWSLDFLDVTIVSILSVKSNSSLKNDHQLKGVYHYNPHTNLITNESKVSQLFPNKAKDLKQYPLNVFFNNFPPESIISKNLSESNPISGINWSKFVTLSEAMNFKMIINISIDRPLLDCINKTKSTGYNFALFHRKAEFLSMEKQRFLSCDEALHEWAVGTVDTKLVLIVPVLSREFYVLNDKWAIFRLFSMTSFPFIISIILHVSRRYSANLQLMYLIQMTLGSSVPGEPKIAKERIIFAAMIITCTLCSPMIYTVLTDVGLHKQTTYNFETVDDVLMSNFPTMVHVNTLRLMKNVFSNTSHLLLQKVISVGDHPNEMIKQVYTTKNITFIGFSMHAEYFLQEERDRCHMPVAKILENDYLAQTISGTVMASRSPYVRRVNVLLHRLIQSGITEKWKHSYIRKLHKNLESGASCFNSSNESQAVLRKIFLIIIIGYSLSIFAFFAELFLLDKLKRIAGNFNFCKYFQGVLRSGR